MGGVPENKDFMARLLAVEKGLRILERTSRLNSASIGSGGLHVKDGGGIFIEDGGDLVIEGDGSLRLLSEDGETDVLLVGDTTGSVGEIGRGLVVRQADNGRLIFQASDNEVDGTSWCAIYDNRGNEVFSLDRDSGYGMAYPKWSHSFVKNDLAEFATTTSATFVSLYTAYVPLTSPEMNIRVVTTVTGTVGATARILADGVVIGANQSFSGATVLDWNDIPMDQFFNDTIAPPHGLDRTLKVEVQLRRDSGTGTPHIQPDYLLMDRS